MVKEGDFQLALKLKRLRTSQDLTQEEFANMLGVSRVTVCAWEAARSYPTRRMIDHIEELFDCDLIHDVEVSYADIVRLLPSLSQRELKALAAVINTLIKED